MPIGRKLLSAGLLVLCACGSIPSKEFEVRAINVEGKPVPCLVVVDGKWPLEGATPSYTDCRVKVDFPRTNIRLLVKPAMVNDAGQVQGVPRHNDPADYKSDSREVQFGDPELQLFILEKDIIGR